MYTDEDHPDSCGFNSRHTGSALWANEGECRQLYDVGGAEVSTYWHCWQSVNVEAAKR